MRDYIQRFPQNKELTFYIADMFPAESVFPGREYEDMTLRVLVFDNTKEHKCLGVLHWNIWCDEYDIDEPGGELTSIQSPKRFIYKWNSIEPLDFCGGQLNPHALYDRSFSAYLEIININNGRQAPIIETMRESTWKPSKQVVRYACKKHGIMRTAFHLLYFKMKCFDESPLSVYLGDFDNKAEFKGWQLVQNLVSNAPSILIDTKNDQIAICISPRPIIKSLKGFFRHIDNGFSSRNSFFLNLLASALNVGYYLPLEFRSLYSQDKFVREDGRDRYRKRIDAMKEFFPRGFNNFFYASGPNRGLANPQCQFIVVVDEKFEYLASIKSRFETWKQQRQMPE